MVELTSRWEAMTADRSGQLADHCTCKFGADGRIVSLCGYCRDRKDRERFVPYFNVHVEPRGRNSAIITRTQRTYDGG